MKERMESTKILREPSVNGSVQDIPVAGGTMKIDSVDVKAEVKDEDGRKSGDSRPPSRKISNGDSDSKMENGKPASVGTENHKSSLQSSTPQQSLSGVLTPSSMMSQHGMVTSLEPPFMQQQSEIFVFSTRLANEAAESVRHGHCKSMIQYHIEHPNTKAFLQKNQLKSSNIRQSMPPGFMGGMKNQQGPGMIRMPGPSPAGWCPQQPSPMDGMMCPEGMMPNGSYHPGSPSPRMMGGWPGQGCGGLHPQGPMGPGGYPLGSIMDMENEMMMMGGPHNLANLASNQIPDEGLTLEQRKHRSRSLAQLTKIHKMLMGDHNQQDGRQMALGQDGHHFGPGMYPGAPGMMVSQQQALMSQHAMMSHGGMMPPHGMMSPQHPHMMQQQAMAQYGHRGPPGMRPQRMNCKDQLQAQHEWYEAQRELYMEKQHHMQHMMANRGPHMDSGPPPSYYSSISQKHGGVGSPPLGAMNGMRMPVPPHGPMGPGMDPDGMGAFGGPPDMCRPSHMGMEPMPSMHGYPPHMTHQGPMDPAFDPPALLGGMQPRMGPGPICPSGPRHHSPIHPGNMMDSNGLMPHVKDPQQGTLHRAGNPEQFNPETMGGVVPPTPSPSGTSNSNKQPPSYAQAQKRKRCSDMDDSYAKGTLQQTLSPTKIHYHLNQFEGQELTITKQLNSAYVASNGGEETGTSGNGNGSGGHFNSHVNSPLNGPSSNKIPHLDSSLNSTHMVSSPAMSTTLTSPHQGPATPHSTPLSSSVPPAGANMRLSHFDPIPLSNGIISSPHTPTPKSSSMSNITSASLVNLAKGVENLSNQMQQNMMQGGPFHSIQVQGQMTGGSNSSNTSSVNGIPTSTTIAATTSSSSSPSINSSSSHQVTATASQAAGGPNVNNTFIATNLSISQVNLPNHSSVNNYVNMQNMNSESTNMNMPPCSMQHSMGPHMGPGMIVGGSRSGMSHHMSQTQGMMTPVCPISGVPSPGMGPSMPSGMNSVGPMPPHRPHSSSSMPATPPTISKSQFTSPPLSHPHMSVSGSLPEGASASFPITSNSNSNVQIQQKGHNTIQYLPANPPSLQPVSSKQRSELEFNMSRFPSPIHTMDGKNQSTLQYFPSSSPNGHRHPQMPNVLSSVASMGSEFANQATIAMHQSASMMRSLSIPDLHALHGTGPGMPPSSVGHMGPGPMMGPLDMGMGSLSHMRPGHSPGSLHPMPPCLGPGSLECVSPIPGMGGYMNNGPSIEQAQAQAQAHAAMMMQGNSQLPVSSPHGPMPPCGDPSPHTSMVSMPGTSMHGPMPPGGISLPSGHGPLLPGQSQHGPPLNVQSPHGSMPFSISGPSPHGPMPGSIPGPSLHGHMSGPLPHSSMMGLMPPHGHMGHIHGPGMPSGSMPRQTGMGAMRVTNMPGQFGMQYPGYQQDYYPSGPARGPQRQMVPGMIGSPAQPYGMMSSMPGPG